MLAELLLVGVTQHIIFCFQANAALHLTTVRGAGDHSDCNDGLPAAAGCASSTRFGDTGGNAPALTQPGGILASRNGTILIGERFLDMTGNRILVYSAATLMYAKSWYSDRILALDATANGNILVAAVDAYSNVYLEELSLTGASLARYRTSHILAIAAAPNGDVFGLVFSIHNGFYVPSRWPGGDLSQEPASCTAEFPWGGTSGLAVDKLSGNIVVTFAQSQQIMVFNSDCSSILRIVKVPYTISAVAIGPDGKIFVVAEIKSQRTVYVYDSSVRYLGRYGTWLNPTGSVFISVDADGVVWVSQTDDEVNKMGSGLRITCFKAP